MPMWLRKAAFLALVVGAASSQAQPGALVASPQSQELQSFLDGQSETDRHRMLDKQQRTFQLEIDGRYAKALKAYCDTGYGDDRCFRPETVKPAPAILALPAPPTNGAVPPPPGSAKV